MARQSLATELRERRDRVEQKLRLVESQHADVDKVHCTDRERVLLRSFLAPYILEYREALRAVDARIARGKA